MVGWPPVKTARKNNSAARRPEKYVKVAVDGAALLRKVDLEAYKSYEEVVAGLGSMLCINIRTNFDLVLSLEFCDFVLQLKLKRYMLIILIIESEDCEGEVKNLVNGTEYVLTYEDKDGDWMMAGDVPWK